MNRFGDPWLTSVPAGGSRTLGWPDHVGVGRAASVVSAGSIDDLGRIYVVAKQDTAGEGCGWMAYVSILARRVRISEAGGR
jgi:hypothetical protein